MKPRQLDARYRIGVALAASFCFHALLLFCVLAAPAWIVQPSVQRLNVLHLRLATPAFEKATASVSTLMTAPQKMPIRPRLPAAVDSPIPVPPSLGETSAMAAIAAWVPDTHYYHSEELSSKPALIYNIAVAMPFPGESGNDQNLLAELFINEYGGVDRVEIVQSTLQAASNERLKEAFRDAKFRPGEVDGFQVKNRMLIEIKIGVASSEASP